MGSTVHKDILRLSKRSGGLVGITLTHAGESSIRLDSLELVGVTRGIDTLTVVKNGKLVLGARRPAERVTGPSGDVTAKLGEAGYITAIAETLTVNFAPSGSESLGAALSIEAAPASERSGNLQVLVPARLGHWKPIASRSIGAKRDPMIVEGINSDVVRLVFDGECRVSGIYQVVPSSQEAALVPLTLTRARDSEDGEVAMQAGDLGSVSLGSGEGIDLTFDVADAAVTDMFLVLNTSGGTLAPSNMRTSPRIPTAFALYQSAPNPFGQTTTIQFALPTRSKIKLELFDLSGRRIRSLVEGDLPAGFHRVDWNGRDDGGRRLGPGMYVYRLTAGSFRASKRLIFTP